MEACVLASVRMNIRWTAAPLQMANKFFCLGSQVSLLAVIKPLRINNGHFKVNRTGQITLRRVFAGPVVQDKCAVAREVRSGIGEGASGIRLDVARGRPGFSIIRGDPEAERRAFPEMRCPSRIVLRRVVDEKQVVPPRNPN